MAFKKMQRQKYPPRLWALVGYPGGGKSSFATQMRGPLLSIDADNRFTEVLHLTQGDVYEISAIPADNTDTERIAALLTQNMPGSDVATIVVDSLTTIIAPLVTQAIMDNDAGMNKNRIAAFKAKALAMRQLQDNVTKWGTDVLWIYHLQDSRDGGAKAVTRATISTTEEARLLRCLNLKLEVVQAGPRRGVKVAWARRGRSGMTLWDDSGTWAGMPERIEAAVYDGLNTQDQERIEQSTPSVFPGIDAALAWAMERDVFKDELHARNAYEKLKEENNPQTAEAMAELWIADVQRRQGQPQEDSEASQAPPPPDEPEYLLDEFFPREPKPEPSGNDQAAEFWEKFHDLVAQGKVHESWRNAPQVQEAEETGDWDGALKFIRSKIRLQEG